MGFNIGNFITSPIARIHSFLAMFTGTNIILRIVYVSLFALNFVGFKGRGTCQILMLIFLYQWIA